MTPSLRNQPKFRTIQMQQQEEEAHQQLTTESWPCLRRRAVGVSMIPSKLGISQQHNPTKERATLVAVIELQLLLMNVKAAGSRIRGKVSQLASQILEPLIEIKNP